MDVSKWNLDKIMQLPDWCFGTRYEVCVARYSPNGATTWDMSEVSLPNVFVLWEVGIYTAPIDYNVKDYRLALGNKVPNSTAKMDRCMSLVVGLGLAGAEPRVICAAPRYGQMVFHPRRAIQSQARRLILEMTATTGQDGRLQVICIVSSIPKEVPDWLFSAHPGLRL